MLTKFFKKLQGKFNSSNVPQENLTQLPETTPEKPAPVVTQDDTLYVVFAKPSFSSTDADYIKKLSSEFRGIINGDPNNTSGTYFRFRESSIPGSITIDVYDKDNNKFQPHRMALVENKTTGETKWIQHISPAHFKENYASAYNIKPINKETFSTEHQQVLRNMLFQSNTNPVCICATEKQASKDYVSIKKNETDYAEFTPKETKTNYSKL